MCSHRCERAAEIAAHSLTHFDDDEQLAVETDEVKFTRRTTQIASEDSKPFGFQVGRDPCFGGGAAFDRGWC